MQINQNSRQTIKKSNTCMGRLMVLFDKGQKTIENWLDDNDVRFQIPAAVEIIKSETGLSESEIFDTQTAQA